MDSEIDIHEKVTDLFIKEKRSVSEIENILFAEGVDSETAQMAIREVSNRVKTLKIERAKSIMIKGYTFIALGIAFSVIRANAGSDYGGVVDFIGLVAILYGVYAIIKGYRKKSQLKREDFSRNIE
ncbi:MAG: hypothetical protein LBI15_08645 [Dysgonamonadaceae bacterium]|jgi:uncharacterized membrane protein|nr:hypothetical protein [Dysgonamonadaceae bacterium]